MDKEIILKSIDEAISKCSRPKYFSKGVLQVFDNFAKSTRDLDHERGLYLDNDGNIIKEREGDYGSVHFSDYDAWTYVIGDPNHFNEINIEHNHPTINGFDAMPPLLSRGDTHMLVQTVNGGFTFRSITAESNGKRMSLVRQYKKDWNDEWSVGNDYLKKLDKACDHLDSVFTDYIRAYGSKLEEYTNVPMGELQGFFKNPKGDFTDKDYRVNISQQCLDEIGSLQSYLEKSGVIDELGECDVLLQLSE